MGCSVVTGSRLTNPPFRLAASAWGCPVCSALRPSSSDLIGCERRWYAAVCETQAVSPPVGGTESRVRRVIPGGWRS